MKRPDTGSTLMAVLVLISTMALIMGAVFMITTGEARFMKRSVDRAAAIAYADGVLENIFDQWRNAMTSGTSLTTVQKNYGLTGAELTGTAYSFRLAPPATSVLPAPKGMTLSSWNITASDPYGTVLSSTSRPTLENGTNSHLLIRMYYVATATVTYPQGQVTVQRTFTRAGTNVFNNFLFSAQPVTEIDPGAPMYINGTIYAGGSLYIQSSNLNLQQDTSYTGSLTIGPAPSDGHSAGSGNPTWPSGDPPHLGSEQKLIDVLDSSFDQNYVGAGSYSDPGIYSGTNPLVLNPNDKGYHELLEEQSGTYSDPLQIDTGGDNERLASNADYRIYVDASNNVTIYKSGTSTTALSGTSAEYQAIANALVTNTVLYDGRVGSAVRLLTVDVNTISKAYAANTITDNNVYAGAQANDGLLLYVEDTSAGTTSTVPTYNYNIKYASGTNGVGPKIAYSSSHLTSGTVRGIRLVNSGSLPTGHSSGSTNLNGGLTVASPNPVYIQGDYNTGSTMTGSFTSGTATFTNQPTSNNGSSVYTTGTSSPDETSGTYSKQPSVIAADAVTILSNNWSDANSNASISNRTPANTTINAAIVSGNVPTATLGGNGYSGGIENFPRLLENWSSSKYLTIHGSFALLYNSEQATQPWTTAGYYNAPNRRWFFDSILQNYNPPGFPAAYTYTRGPWKTK